ncbi:transposase [Vogesella sp. AC12]|uniref:transposase n=1 Tax=Vogesella sp. AC12 TaxID=2950550 RepID=UPI00351ECB8F
MAQHVPALRKALPEILEDAENGLSVYFRTLLDGLRADLVYLDEQIDRLDQNMQHQASTNAQARKLQQLRGIGPITATALVAAIGQNSGQFKRGRDLAA